MTNTDCLKNEITSTNHETTSGINDFIQGFLSYDKKASIIVETAEKDPKNCLANSYASMLWMFLESPEAPEKAKPFLEKAQEAKAVATQRESKIVDIVHDWAVDDIPNLLRKCENLLDIYPRDLVVLKLAQTHYFNIGDSAGMLRVALKGLPEGEKNPYLHGMIAFGYEQCHLIREAEESAKKAMSIKWNEPWSHHALAHVMLTEGRVEEGITFLESVSKSWKGLNSFMYTHNWWHLALFYLSKGRNKDALKVYDNHVWGIEKNYSQDQIGATSLLARIEFSGVDVAGRWEDLAKYISKRSKDTTNPFNTMQYLFALGKANHDSFHELLLEVRNKAKNKKTFNFSTWTEVVLPACEGIMSHIFGRHSECVTLLGRALPRIFEAGGSHAQRDFFNQIHLDSLIKSGNYSAAQQILESRRSFDPNGVPLNKLLEKIYFDLGLPKQSNIARERWQKNISQKKFTKG